jgi:hypothetical protein
MAIHALMVNIWECIAVRQIAEYPLRGIEEGRPLATPASSGTGWVSSKTRTGSD